MKCQISIYWDSQICSEKISCLPKLRQPQRETSKKTVPRNFENLLDRGAVFNEILPLALYYRSPLVRGGLEISRQLTIKLSKGEYAKALLERHDTLLNDYTPSDYTLSCIAKK